LSGKGYKICGNSLCSVMMELNPYEVNMKYEEHDEIKNALVKIYLCDKCGGKLNKMYKYLKKKRKRDEKKMKIKEKKEVKKL
jgi:protein FRA10AC1